VRVINFLLLWPKPRFETSSLLSLLEVTDQLRPPILWSSLSLAMIPARFESQSESVFSR